MAKGYTRRQAAEIAGVSKRTLDSYVRQGVATGRIQFVEGHGHMRVFTEGEVERLTSHAVSQRAKQPEGLRRYNAGPPVTLEENP